MAKNLIPEVCKLLGVEVGEEFKLNNPYWTYKFTEKEIVGRSQKYPSWTPCKGIIEKLINGKLEIIKLPWKPKNGEVYHTFDVYSNCKNLHACEYPWRGYVIDYALFKAGWVYRTKEEAKAALPKVAEELGVEYEL